MKENTEPISHGPGAKALLEMVSTLRLPDEARKLLSLPRKDGAIRGATR